MGLICISECSEHKQLSNILFNYKKTLYAEKFSVEIHIII